MASDIVKEVLRGRVENVPSIIYDVVRLYMCSTFTDMTTERNYLMKHVYPKLYQYCLENYALQFHPVDLRVGMKGLESDDHETLQLCLDEIKQCQSYSIGPNFVLLLGQKYGTVMLPKRIPEDEYVVLRKSMQGGERDFIDTWYLKDTNALPAIYVLQPRYSKQGIIWALVEARLRDQLQEAALVCVANQLLTDEQAKKYFNSNLEEEVIHGILNNPNAEQQCLLFTRSMNNVNSEHKNANNYVDIINDEIDPLAQRQLLDLVDQKLFEKLPAYNIYQYENLEWSDANEGGINEKDHGEYLKDLAGDFEGAMKKMIDQAVANRDKLPSNDHIYKECLQHAEMVKENSAMFWGRKEEMKQIEDYMNDRLSGYPLMLYGHAGCGKTTVVAKAASLMYKEWAKEPESTYQVIRFLGKTPATREIIPLLKNVVQNLVDILSPDVFLPREFTNLPSAFEELSSLFNSIIKLVPKSKKLVIMLDGLDELVKSENAFELHWVPIKLPMNVKIILSCDDQGYDFIETLKDNGFPISNFVNIPGLSAQSSMALLKHWTSCHDRTLTPHQWKSIAVTLGRKTHRPLYLRLLLDGLLKWHSYDKTYLRSPPKDVTACIRVLFEQLEETHGQMLVSHAFGLLAVTKYGLSLMEMEDILSLDEEVMQSVWREKTAFIYRLPSMVLRRLQRDARYLMYGEAQGCRVMFWKHRLFHEASEILFLRTRPVQEAVFLNLLVDYYTGKWATTPKAYTANGKSVKNGTKNNDALALRYVPRQVNMFATKDSEQNLRFHFNHRKLSELPAALISLAEIDSFSMESLKRLAKTVIFNYEMMYAYLKSGRAEDYIGTVTGHWVLDPIQDQSEEFVKRELYILARYLTDKFKYITDNPDSAGPFIASQLIVFYGYLPNITRFLDKVDSIGRSTCALVPTSQQGNSSLSLAHCKISNHTQTVVDVVVTERFIYSLSNKLVAMRYSQSHCKVQYSAYIRVPEQDRFQILTAGKQNWTGKYFPDDESSKHDNVHEKILLYAALQLRPHIYILDSSNGEVLQIIKMDEINRDLMAQRIMYVHVVGEPTSVNHLLCVVMHSGSIVIVDISNKQIVWKDTRGKPLIGAFDSGYRDAVQVLGYFQTTGEIVWLTWTNLDEKFTVKNQLSPCVGISEICKASTEVFTNIAVTGRCEYGRNCDTVHAVLSTNHGSVIYVWKLLRIMYGSDSAVYTEKILNKKKQCVVTLPSREQLVFLACDRSAYGLEEGQVYVVCGTDSRTFVLSFCEKETHGTILYTLSSVFEHVVLEQYVFYGVAEGSVSMFEYLEEPFRLYTYGTVDEHQGRMGKLLASDGGYLFVTTHDEGGVYLYRSDILVLMARRTQTEKGAVQSAIGTLQCGYILAATLSTDRRTLAVWDIQTCTLKREITFQTTVEQFRLSESETHVAAVTGGKLMLYTVEHEDDLPATPILELQLKNEGGNCWLTTVRSQPGSICIITEVGSITTVNVQTCQILHDSKTKMPADIDDVIIRNDNVYIIYHGRRTFLAVHPVSGQATWELDMDSKTGKSLQKFGDAILDIAEYDDSVYALLTSTQADSLHLNLLCVKPHSNSIYKILDLSLPRRVEFVCSYGNSKHIVLHHHDTVRIIDMSQNCVKMEEKLTCPQITSDGQYLVGVLEERYVKLYRLEDTKCIGSFKLNTDIDCLAISADDEYVTAVGHDKKIYGFVIADPKQSMHTLTIKKLPSRRQAPLNGLETYREDPRYQTLREMTQVLEEGFPQMLEIDAEEVKNEPLQEKADSPVRITPIAPNARGTPGPAYKPRKLSYGTANLQTSTAHRLQKVKNRFIEVDLSTPTPTRRISSPSRQGPGRERHRLLLNMMNRAASAKSTRSSISRGSNLLSSPSKSRLSLVSAKNVQISLRNGAVSPTKSLSLSMSRSRPNSTMSKTCVIS